MILKLKDIEFVKWSAVSAQFQQLFPDLFPELDRLFKKHAPRFGIARYPFGTQPVENGRLKVPYQGQLLDIASEELPENIRAELTYPNYAIPIAAVMGGSLESIINLPNHLIPLRILKPGTIFSLGTLNHTDQYSHVVDRAYSYTSGARSMVILAKISHEQYNERILRHYSIDRNVLCPKTFADQWNLFRELAHSPEFKSEWETELLLFPKAVFDLLGQDPVAKNLMLARLWQYSLFSNNQMMYDLVWSIFFEKLSTAIKNAPSILETVKHIIKLCMSEAPGYIPVTNEDQLPVKEFMHIYLSIYRIRYYLPTFMEVGYYNRHDPIYYSLQKHTFFYNMPEKEGASRTIDELIAIKRLIQSFKQQVLENKFPFSLENTILYKTLQEVEFDFYHPQGTEELNTDIETMVNEDPRFMALLRDVKYDPALTFPIHSLFFNGCIRVRPLKKVAAPTMKDFLGSMGVKPGGNFRLDKE